MMLERVNSELRKQIQLIISDMHDPRIGGEGVRVSGVETTADLKYATVYVLIAEKERKKEILNTLQNAGGFIRKELKTRVLLRVIPELKFKADESQEYGSKIDAILDTIKKKENDED